MSEPFPEFYVYSRVLAQRLLAHGCESKPIPNLLHPDRQAWSFTIDRDLCEIVTAYYQADGRPTPRVIKDFLAADPDEGEGRA